MKLFSRLFFLIGMIPLTTETGLNARNESNKPQIQTTINRKNVLDISAIKRHAQDSENVVFLIDADEVLFTQKINDDGSNSLVRLYDDLEGIFSEIRKQGHKLFILTYNKAAEIRRKLLAVKLDEKYFDGILSCEMQGDILTSKGDLLRKLVGESKTKFDSFVFIDNFPPFVKDVENVAKEMNLKLHSYLCTGYIDLYHEYVYHHLSKLQKDSSENREKNNELTRIMKSLAKYHIEISRFLEQYPDFESFKQFATEKKLIWPYLTYL